jgi:hypothetical protein
MTRRSRASRTGLDGGLRFRPRGLVRLSKWNESPPERTALSRKRNQFDSGTNELPSEWNEFHWQWKELVFERNEFDSGMNEFHSECNSLVSE